MASAMIDFSFITMGNALPYMAPSSCASGRDCDMPRICLITVLCAAVSPLVISNTTLYAAVCAIVSTGINTNAPNNILFFFILMFLQFNNENRLLFLSFCFCLLNRIERTELMLLCRKCIGKWTKRIIHGFGVYFRPVF